MADGGTRVKPVEKKKITSNMFILFSKARENKRPAKDREEGQEEASYLQQASWEMRYNLIQHCAVLF